jgi:hypothetical protein
MDEDKLTAAVRALEEIQAIAQRAIEAIGPIPTVKRPPRDPGLDYPASDEQR